MKIEIMEYNPDWTKNFEEEKIKLLHFFGSHAVAIEHIGSTAIPNQRAKPVIDIFIGVSPFAELTFYQRIFSHKPKTLKSSQSRSRPFFSYCRSIRFCRRQKSKCTGANFLFIMLFITAHQTQSRSNLIIYSSRRVSGVELTFS